MDINVPNLGDGIESAVVISILVKPGETVSKDQTILELETDKAVAPMGAPESGTIETITINEGDTVSTGNKVGTLSGGTASADTAPTPTPPPQAAPQQPIAQSQAIQATPIVAPVGYQPQSGIEPPMGPGLKKLCYRIGLDTTRIQATGKNGRLTESDVVNHIQYLQSLMDQPVTVQQPVIQQPKTTPLPDFTKWGEVDVEKCSSLRKKIAEKMTESWTTVPHVTQHLDIDITDMMALRKKYNPKYQKKGVKLTLTVFAIKAVQKALQSFPNFNSSYDLEKNELHIKNYLNIGIAVDTPNGLIVPVIRNVDEKNMLQLGIELNEIAEKARNRTLAVEDLQGGGFTISNLGGLGVGGFTPIINTPEVAILGIGTGQFMATKGDKDQVVFRLKMPSCISYDHRVIDGADGARFMTELKSQFESFDESELKEI